MNRQFLNMILRLNLRKNNFKNKQTIFKYDLQLSLGYYYIELLQKTGYKIKKNSDN